MPAFSLFAILGVASLRLRLRNRCGLGLNRNPPFLDGHYPITGWLTIGHLENAKKCEKKT
jgi:hypothetical protein